MTNSLGTATLQFCFASLALFVIYLHSGLVDGFLRGETKTKALNQPLLILAADHKDSIEWLKKSPDEMQRNFVVKMQRGLEELQALAKNSRQAEIRDIHAEHSDFAGNGLDNARVQTVAFGAILNFLNSRIR